MTLAASLAGRFRARTRSRYRRLWPFRFCLAAAVARYRCCAFHCDQARAPFRHGSPQ